MPDGRVEAQPLEISEETSFSLEDNLLRFLRARVQVSTSSSSSGRSGPLNTLSASSEIGPFAGWNAKGLRFRLLATTAFYARGRWAIAHSGQPSAIDVTALWRNRLE